MGKPEIKKPDGKKLIEDVKKSVKNKKKEQIDMKKVISLTVFATLATLAIIGGIFYAGMIVGGINEKTANERIVTEAQTLAKQIAK